jgi:putative salt-induced outer membrane protein YdiY
MCNSGTSQTETITSIAVTRKSSIAKSIAFKASYIIRYKKFTKKNGLRKKKTTNPKTSVVITFQN